MIMATKKMRRAGKCYSLNVSSSNNSNDVRTFKQRVGMHYTNYATHARKQSLRMPHEINT